MNSRELLEIIIGALDSKHAEDTTVLDMQEISLLADYFIICHGNSDKQVQGIVRGVKEAVEQCGGKLQRLEGYDSARWVLVDVGDIVVHVFHKDERSYYSLEKLWGDAPRVDNISNCEKSEEF